MTAEKRATLRSFYFRELTEDVVPFWLRHGLDREHGGILDFLDRDGSPLSTDKGGWAQGRAAWVFSALANELGPRPEWMEAARSCADFVRDKVLAGPGGRAYFELTRDGRPLVLRRYLFAEAFAAMGLAEFARASGDPSYLEAAEAALATYDDHRGALEPKVDPRVRPMRGHSDAMLMINVFQVLRRADPAKADVYGRRIRERIDELFRYFVKPGLRALLETVAEDGGATEGCEGRCLNPGHAIETAWFLLEEARTAGDAELARRAIEILDWSLERGWDKEFGGLFSFLDVEGRQPAQVEWDMKYWWPHCEAGIATLMAYAETGDPKWEAWFDRVHEYAFSRFPDREKGEWFGYLRRDGSVANSVKGNHFKVFFHVPRFMLKTIALLDGMDAGGRP